MYKRQVVSGALKGAIFAANVYERLGFDVVPNSTEPRYDIIQAITFGKPEGVIAFCQGIQAVSYTHLLWTGGTRAYVRRSLSRRRGLFEPSRSEGLQGRHRRADGGSESCLLYTSDFRENRISTGFGAVTPQFEGQFAFGNLREVLPEALSAAMLEGMEHFGHVIHGFDREDAVFAGVESRTSSPLRIPRDHATMESSTIAGIYPCGEGAGYARCV